MIWVGGGLIYTDYKGITELIYNDNSFLLLKDTLYIPGLRMNLFLIRRVYQINLKGLFNKVIIYFKQGKKKVISIKINQRFYIIININKSLIKTIFVNI